jgi:hypothetical protein
MSPQLYEKTLWFRYGCLTMEMLYDKEARIFARYRKVLDLKLQNYCGRVK